MFWKVSLLLRPDNCKVGGEVVDGESGGGGAFGSSFAQSSSITHVHHEGPLKGHSFDSVAGRDAPGKKGYCSLAWTFVSR